MKRVMAITMALLLATNATTALADRDWDDDDDDHHHGHHDKHYWKHHGNYHPYYSTRVYYYPYPPRHHHYYGYDPYLPLGAALVGAAVSYSLFHTHDGVRCDDNHSVSQYRNSSEVIGCHRIERYPDGSERRVDLPISECY